MPSSIDETTFSSEAPSWLRSLAFSSLSGGEIGEQTYSRKSSGRSESRKVDYVILEEGKTGATIRIEKYKDERGSIIIAATYIIVDLDNGANSETILNHLERMLPEPKPLLWIEKCKDFEQRIAIHFDSYDFDNLDQLLSLSKELLVKSTPHYLNGEGFALKALSQKSTTPTLAIMDTPISEHDFLTNADIIALNNGYESIGNCMHGTFVLGILKQFGSNFRFLVFPVKDVIVLAKPPPHQYQDIEIMKSNWVKILTKIGLVAAALKAFLDSDIVVANFSFGVTNTSEEAIYCIAPLMKKLRLKGSILVMAAGNNGIDIDNGIVDLFAHFINYKFTGEDNKPYVMDNIVFVAAVDQQGHLARFSNFGRRTVLLAAPGVGIYSCSSPNNFERLDGTSFAAPQVAATLAVMVDHFHTENYYQIIARLIASVDKDETLEGTTISGGRLNIGRALGEIVNLEMNIEN